MASPAHRFRNCIGPRLRGLRTARKLTQEALSARLQLAGLHNWDRVTVAKVESRLRSVYDYELAILCEVLAVDSSKLMLPRSVLESELDDLIRGMRKE